MNKATIFPEDDASEAGVQTTIRQHHDKGPRLTPRDRLCLLWIALQGAIRLDQLQKLLLRYTPEQDRQKVKPGADRLSLERAYATLERWRLLDLVERDPILHKGLLWIWLSRAGLREIGVPFAYGKGKPASIRLPHLYYVNQVRLAIEEKRPQDTWKSERELRRELGRLKKGEQRPHLPDALLYAANGIVTDLEIEIQVKDEEELEETLRTLAVQYRSVWYFASGPARRKIEAILETFTLEMRKPFVLYDLKTYGEDYGIS